MSSTSMNLTKIPVVPGYDDPSPCPSPSDRCTSCGGVDAFGGTMSCPSCSKSFCPSCFPPTQHEPCRRSACPAPILLEVVVLRGIAGVLARAASRLADLLEERTQVPEIAYNDLLGERTQTQVPEVAYNVVVDEAIRFDANVDSGTSVSASGRRCLFPTELITKWHPETSVRSASQQKMDVLFIGTMILHTECGQKIYIANSLCVPEMGDLTLISPKQLFHGSGIRTEFNDIRALRVHRVVRLSGRCNAPHGCVLCSQSHPGGDATRSSVLPHAPCRIPAQGRRQANHQVLRDG